MHLNQVPALYMYTVNHSAKWTCSMELLTMIELAKKMGLCDKKTICAGRKLRMYLNTIHNYYLKQRKAGLLGNTDDKFLLYYDTLLKKTTFIDKILTAPQDLENI